MRGGKRQGAGRPKENKEVIRRSVSLEPGDLDNFLRLLKLWRKNKGLIIILEEFINQNKTA